MVGEFSFKPILMHYPVALLPFRRPPPVEHKRLLHPQEGTSLRAIDLPIFSGRLPVASLGGPIGSQAGGILPVAEAEKVPLFLPHLGLFCLDATESQ